MSANFLPRLFRLSAVSVVLLGLTACEFGTGNGPESIPGTPQDPDAGEQLVLVFSDEFDEGTMPDPEKWNLELGYGPNGEGWGNNEWQLYTDSPDNVRVEGGNLVIQARCDAPPCGSRDDTVTSARINTQGNFDFRYGRIEARIQAPTGKGAWPAFWSLGSAFPGTPWPRAGEIDFMELFDNGSDPDTTHFTMHWCAAQPDNCNFPNGYATQTEKLVTDEDLSLDFHVYSAEWDATRVVGKIDGVTYFVANIDPATMEEFRRRFFLILNVAMGGTLGSGSQPPAGDEVWPQTMLVDWVRVYQREADIGGGEGGIIDFEESGEPYTFINFEGGVGFVSDNPVPSDFNNSPRVATYQKFRAESGATFGGSRLEIPQEVPANTSYTMKMYATRPVSVLFKLEENTDGTGGVERTLMHGGTGWEQLTFDFTAAAGSYPGGITMIFDNGTLGDAGMNPADWTFYVDDIEPVTDDGPIVERTFFDFEADGAPYIFEEFEGGVAFATDNPQMNGINLSAGVAEMRKTVGAAFAGTTLVAPMTVPTGSAFIMKVWSQRPVPVLLKLEDDADPPNELEVMHSGSGWEELRFEFPAYSGSIRGLTTIFDNGEIGDFDRDPVNWTFYIDDLELVDSDPNAGLDPIDLPITFDDPNTNYTVTDFGGAATTIVADPDDAANNVAQTVKPEGAMDFAGVTMSTPSGLASAIPFADGGNNTIGVRVYSPEVGIPVRLKVEQVGDPGIFVEVDANTTVANAWEDLAFDFSNPIAGSPALDFAVEYRLLNIFFNIGTDGDTAGTQTYLWDDVEFGVAPPDTDPPTLTSVSIASDNPSPMMARAGDTVTVTFAANENLMPPTVTIGGASATVTGMDANWEASRVIGAGDANGAVTFEISYADLAGNDGTPGTATTDSSMVVVDTMAPTVVVTDAPATFTSLDPIPLTFQFSEAVAGFDDVSDVMVTNGRAISVTAVDMQNYTVVIGPSAAGGDLSFSVVAGVAVDLAGNPNTMSMPVTVTDDLAGVPLTDVSIASDNANPAFAKEGDTVTVSLTAPAAINMPTVTIAGAAADMVTGAGDTWQATRTMLGTDAEGEVAFEIDFQYADTSPGVVTPGTSDGTFVTYDITAPTLSITGIPDEVVASETVAATFTFSEEVVDFDASDVMVTNGSAANFAPGDDGSVYTADVTADGMGALTVEVAAGGARDQAGNDSELASVTATLLGGPAYRLLWSDDFESGSLDAATWTARTDANCPDPCTGEQSYLAERVSVAGGELLIEARDILRSGGGSFTSGLVDTLGNQEFRYGRIEIDARMPGTNGSLPSLWLLPVPDEMTGEGEYGPWPQSGQIDIVNAPEIGVSGNLLNHATRYGLPEPEDTVTDFDYDPPFAPDGGIHTYAVEWNADEIRWYVDGVNVVTQTAPNWYAYFQDDDGVYTDGTGGAPFDQDFYLLIGLAMSTDAGSGTYPQTLAIDEVRVFECANPDDPALGTGCITGTASNELTAEPAPYTESYDVYIDAPATVDFFDPDNPGTPVSGTLVIGTDDSGGAAVVNSDPAAMDGGDTFWNLDISAPATTGTAFVMGADTGSGNGIFNLTGSETAGELLFRMRVNSGSAAAVDVGLTSSSGAGVVSVPVTADGTWRNYSVKIGDVVANSAMGMSLDIAAISNTFTLAVTNGSADIDLDDISVKAACRDTDGCSAQPTLPMATVLYQQDFEAMLIAEGFPPNSVSDDGWRVFGNVYLNPTDTTPINSYGAFLAPNGTGGFCAVEGGQGGASQGAQQFSIFSDYNNFTAHGAGQYVESLVFQERTIVADDIGTTVVLSFDAKAGLIELQTTATAYFKTLDPMNSFATTNEVELDTTNLPNTWMRYEIMLDLTDPMLEGQILQFGFASIATMFEGSSVFYDNVELRQLSR
ncbi:MAG: family 16 glycosylhydrolase [Pseudomonadota bacterium]